MLQTICPRCGHDNPDAPLYCANCGTDIEEAFQQSAKAQVTCPSCHSTVQSDAFCSRCGAKISISPQLQQPIPQGQKQSPGVWHRLGWSQKVGICCLGFILLIIVVLSINQSDRSRDSNTAPTQSTSRTSAKSSGTSSKTVTPRAYSTMVQNLAIIEGVENDESKLSKISTLLAQLDTKYPENEQQIGDMTAAAYNEIRKKGHSASIIGVMEAMMTVSEAKSGISYADAVTSYALLRVNGMK